MMEKTNPRSMLIKHFSVDDLNRINRHGYDDGQILNAVEVLRKQNVTRESTVRDVFFEAFPELLRDVPDTIFSAKKASEFGPLQLRFVWYPYIVRDEINVWMASGGTGKTMALCLIISYITRGLALPGDIKPNKPENVLYISGEDKGEVLRDRLVKCNADLDRVSILDCIDSVGLNYGEKPDEFKAFVSQYNPDLVVIDPLTSFLGNINMDKRNMVRPVMQNLAAMAKSVGCAIILISHLNKKSQEFNLNNCASGSSDFIDAARSAVYLAFDEEDENSRLIVHSKYNYTERGRTIRYTFNSNGGAYWNGYSNIDRFTIEEANRRHKTPSEVLKQRSERDELTEVLIRALADSASDKGVVKFSYDQFKERYGNNIFGNIMPKRMLDSLAEPLKLHGLKVETGKRIRIGNNVENGFFISPIPQDIPEEISECD